MSFTALTNARVFDGSAFVEDKVVLIENQSVAGLLDTLPENTEVIDCRGLLLAPGFMELQVYGGKGSLFTTEISPESIRKTYEEHLEGGTTHFQVTYHTGPLSGMLKAIEACRTYRAEGGAGLLGLHLEGPYFSPAKKGAHILKYIRKPTIAELQLLVDAAGDLPLFLTLAPEEADEEVLDWLLDSPIRLSAGHSNATYEQAQHAFDKGIGLVTHLFNAMSPFGSREPGLLGATFDSHARASIIVDGIHVNYASVRIAKEIMKERLFLITDAVTEDLRGEYVFRMNPQTARFEDASGTLSGSNLKMMEAVANCVRKVGIPMEEALRMASLYPAQAIRQEYHLGRVAPGFEASLLLFTPAFELKALYTNGHFRWV
ncbi:N-acetylglucosamine-6-phosphate deacetylase [Siphonobacter aquaeclarae]|uniref:N-acetylglucosamine 6-phosphate deacetylase n=1 Tax=Siphonobacter aquaeclarae TaxID=563176 RepID=A0A1G9MD02_9BACT|nr:N-acetylglucosamine-6-phosphate deacetylase [Siphonobacter aquaeclarae]SDL72160.1 N-acetylglucosamine 6-phosphate deacetylase [Siphonobacter aquaeclarae]